eukprot:s4204_g2.t1
MQDADVTAGMLEAMYKEMPESQRGYVNLTNDNPNERDHTQPADEDQDRIQVMKQTLFETQAKATKKYLKKRDGGFDSSESDAPSADDDRMLDFGMRKKIAAKNMPRPNTPPPKKKSSTASAVGSAPRKVWKKKEDTSESEPEPASSSARRPAEASAGRTAKAQTTNKAPAPKRETSSQAKDLFRDAEAARNVYQAWSQEFSNIQWTEKQADSPIQAHSLADESGNTEG